jgi:pimeloyl-ACP methyl ester carboxylesterase
VPRLSRVLPAVAVAAVLASCSAAVPGTPSAGVSLEKVGPAGAVPAGLEEFYGQTLAWGDCEPFATTANDRRAYGSKKDVECARLAVPLDYANPGGERVELGLLRRRASSQQERIGSLLVNPGGPGASGMAAAASLAANLGDLGRRFDLVGFDPRGVGASEPQVRCLTDAERDADRLDVDVDTTPAGIAETEAENKTYAEKCAANTSPEVLANVGTRDVVRDLDVMRSALGDEKLSYVGYSYGTRIGSQYAEAFPGNVRALVLDGAVDPTQSQVDSLVAQGAGFQKAFDAFAAWCAQRQDCAVGNDPAKANDVFRQLTLPLIDRPVDVEDRKLSYNDAITGAIQAMYSQELWEPLNSGLAELSDDRGRVLMLLADTYYDRDADGKYSTITDAFNAIHCVDDARITDRAVLDEATRRYKEAAPFLDDGRPAAAALDACAFWPVPNTSQPTVPRVQGLPPVLVISTTGDPATPYQAGVNLANALGGGLLTYEGTQHTVFLQGDACVDPAATTYLVDLTLPAEGTVCAP